MPAVYNALGVDYQLLGPTYFEEAFEYHIKYRDCVEHEGRFIAHTNLGLLLLRANHSNIALNQHALALRYAVNIASELAQAIAISNLSISHIANKNYVEARACMER